MLDFKNDNLHLLAVVVNNTKGFIIVGVIASILSALFSSALFIDPKYKFSAIIYPSNLAVYSGESSIE
jgi:hypothetical protein